MKLSYEYATPSACLQEGDQIKLALSPDLSREEKVSFVGRLKHPLNFRDSMLMLRQIVISDTRIKKKDYTDFFNWFNEELDRRMVDKEKYLKGYKTEIEGKINDLEQDLCKTNEKLSQSLESAQRFKRDIEELAIWNNYKKIEHEFWNFIRNRDSSLWMVLDPVITVHPDQVSFEAFSLDESTYGCLSINNDEFDIVGTPRLGTTNIDFSSKLADEIERFRTYNKVELSINPEGFIIETGITPEHVEKKIELPETWIKGFNQVSAAASLGGVEIEISPVDMYDICSFLHRNREHKSPRSMKWILEPDKKIKIIFEPWNKELTLSKVYQGKKKRIERIWGRRRWLILERIIPIANNFKIRLLGFGMPQFIIADVGTMKITIGFTSWSANDWVKGTAFNILAGFIGEGTQDVYNLLKNERVLTIEDIKSSFKQSNDKECQASIGRVLRRGEAYFDPIINGLRFRQLLNVQPPKRIYEVSELEEEVLTFINSPKSNFILHLNEKSEVVAEDFYEDFYEKQVKRRYRRPPRRHSYYHREYHNNYEPKFTRHTQIKRTEIKLDQDGQIVKLKCDCREFKKGPRNISAPCSHILALYINSIRFIDLPLEPGKKYNIKQLEDLLISDRI